MEIKDFNFLEDAARSITDKPAGGSRGSDKYDKAVKTLLKLNNASSGFVISKKAFKEALVNTDFVEFDSDKDKKPLPRIASNVKYGFTNFRIGYMYQGKPINGSMVNAIRRTGKFYIADGGDILFLVPANEFKAYKKALLATKKPTLKKLVSRLEANFNKVYPPSIGSEVVKATST